MLPFTDARHGTVSTVHPRAKLVSGEQRSGRSLPLLESDRSCQMIQQATAAVAVSRLLCNKKILGCAEFNADKERLATSDHLKFQTDTRAERFRRRMRRTS